MEGVCDGIMRLGALPEGVRKGVFAYGVFAVDAERLLSRLRERFDEAGEAGTSRGVDVEVIACISVLTPPPSLALRLRARSLCSLKTVLSVSSDTLVGSGSGGTRKFEGGMVTGLRGEHGSNGGVQTGAMIGWGSNVWRGHWIALGDVKL